MHALKNYSADNNLFVKTSKKLYNDLDRLEKNNHYNSDTGGKNFIPFFLLNVSFLQAYYLIFLIIFVFTYSLLI